MRYLLITDSPLAATIVSKAALPGEAVRILCTEAGLARSLRRKGCEVITGSLDRPTTWTRAGIDDQTVVVVAVQDAAQSMDVVRRVNALADDVPMVVLDSHHGEGTEAPEDLEGLRNVAHLRLTDVVRAPFQEQVANALVRKRVHQYRDHFEPADRILILLHDDPDPDALASSIALRTLLGRNRQTAIIGTFKKPTRPENIRMVELLGIDVKEITEDDLASFDRIAIVDTQPHIFGDKVPHADLVIDHHPLRTGYTATFSDIRPSFGATTSLLVDYILRCGMTVSERLATAAAYAIKTDTWTFRRGSVPQDVAIFAHIYPRADQGTLRRIETEGFRLETLKLIGEAAKAAQAVGRFLYAHLGLVARDDLVPTAADFLLNVAEAHWTAVSGVLDDTVTISVRNLGYQRSAGDLVQQVFGSLGAAGGHRAAAKAILPLAAVREHFGDPEAPDFADRLFRPLLDASGERQLKADD